MLAFQLPCNQLMVGQRQSTPAASGSVSNVWLILFVVFLENSEFFKMAVGHHIALDYMFLSNAVYSSFHFCFIVSQDDISKMF